MWAGITQNIMRCRDSALCQSQACILHELLGSLVEAVRVFNVCTTASIVQSEVGIQDIRDLVSCRTTDLCGVGLLHMRALQTNDRCVFVSAGVGSEVSIAFIESVVGNQRVVVQVTGLMGWADSIGNLLLHSQNVRPDLHFIKLSIEVLSHQQRLRVLLGTGGRTIEGGVLHQCERVSFSGGVQKDAGSIIGSNQVHPLINWNSQSLRCNSEGLRTDVHSNLVDVLLNSWGLSQGHEPTLSTVRRHFVYNVLGGIVQQTLQQVTAFSERRGRRRWRRRRGWGRW
mmetsp:Transcript_6111/g.6983  ORF Transcript_6111/g.6983 Transcript_6111/m.6983 type:complete len:284 (+) Transcript_6111:3173-4024(+)